MTDVNRVVVTGLGGVTPLGHTAATYWTNLKQGVSGHRARSTLTQTPEELNQKVAAEVKDFDPLKHFDERELSDARPRLAVRGGGGARGDHAGGDCLRHAAVAADRDHHRHRRWLGKPRLMKVSTGSIWRTKTRVFPLTHSETDGECAGEPDLHVLRLARAGLRDRECLRFGDPRHRPCIPYGAVGAGRLCGHRRDRGLRYVRSRARLGSDAGHGAGCLPAIFHRTAKV